jgi:uncharacterized iron-regulated protein
VIIWLFTLWIGSAQAMPAWQAKHETVWDTRARKFIALSEIPAAAGDIFVFGEVHAAKGSETDPETAIHHDNQLRLIRSLQTRATVSVGLEFLTYTYQDLVDQFVEGILPESDFLKHVHWGSNPFQFYRGQILATAETGGRTLALNIPQSIANHVSSAGKDALDPQELRLTPPFWARGNDLYFARFREAMKDHAPADAIERYFWAQSLWDDTMAWKALQHRENRPDDVLVIIAGEFHVLYGGGLPYELRKNGAASVKTVVQVSLDDWTTEAMNAAIAPDPVNGEIADYIWLHSGAVPAARTMLIQFAR